jgi:hypothetical protein
VQSNPPPLPPPPSSRERLPPCHLRHPHRPPSTRNRRGSARRPPHIFLPSAQADVVAAPLPSAAVATARPDRVRPLRHVALTCYPTCTDIPAKSAISLSCMRYPILKTDQLGHAPLLLASCHLEYPAISATSFPCQAHANRRIRPLRPYLSLAGRPHISRLRPLRPLRTLLMSLPWALYPARIPPEPTIRQAYPLQD